MNNNYPSRSFGKVATLLLTLAACKVSAAVTQQSDQVAVQLGAIQLGYTLPVTALTTQQQANALQQGRLALGATVTTYSKTVFVAGASCPNPQSQSFRSELYSATMNALTTPVSNTITSLKVTNSAGTATTVTATLNPTLTTPDLVQSVSTALVPNYGPAFVSNAVVASMAYTTNSNGIVLPVYGPQPSTANINKYATNSYALNKTTSAAQLVTAGKAASAAMTAALKVYATGTVNWAAYPTTGTPTNSAYLPNFGTTTVNTGSNAYAPNQTGLADAAAAVAAAAINGLGAINTNSVNLNSGLYGITTSNATSIASALTKAAVAYQATSTMAISGETHYASGALGADAFGLITQTAGQTNSVWGGQASGGTAYRRAGGARQQRHPGGYPVGTRPGAGHGGGWRGGLEPKRRTLSHPRCHHLPPGRHHRGLDGDDDHGPFPPPAGAGRSRPALWSGFHRRCREKPHRRDRTRSPGSAGLYFRHGIVPLERGRCAGVSSAELQRNFAMRTLSRLAVSGLVLSLFAVPVLAQTPVAPGERVDANGFPTTHSTPAEHAQTEALNDQIQAANAAADNQALQQQAQTQAALDAQTAANNANQAQYEAQKQQYQQQLQQNQAAQQNYEDRTRVYYDLRSRYAAERAAYHRGAWPARYSTWRLQSDARLIGSRVEIITGDPVGMVDAVARSQGGQIEALYVTLDGGKQVWIDEADIRFDTAGKVVMTNLDRADLRAMADERL